MQRPVPVSRGSPSTWAVLTRQAGWQLAGEQQAPQQSQESEWVCPGPSVKQEKEVMQNVPGEERGQGQEGGTRCRWTWSAGPAPVGGPPVDSPRNCIYLTATEQC